MAKSPDDEYSEGLEEQIKQLTEENARLQTIIHHASQMENLDRLERDRLRDALQNLVDSSSVSRANFQTDWDAANEALKEQPTAAVRSEAKLIRGMNTK